MTMMTMIVKICTVASEPYLFLIYLVKIKLTFSLGLLLVSYLEVGLLSSGTIPAYMCFCSYVFLYFNLTV